MEWREHEKVGVGKQNKLLCPPFLRVAPGKSKSLTLPSRFVSPEVDGCICGEPWSRALTKAALMCTVAASSDLCLSINVPCLMGGEKKHLGGRGAQLLWKGVQDLFSCTDAAIGFALCPASLYSVSSLGHPLWVSTLIPGTGVWWDGVILGDVAVVTLSFCVDCLLSRCVQGCNGEILHGILRLL